ncbi:hypothetical protein A2130_04630 [Candidatus Woesebacteria bacterium GWC2_33_12]|uniref:HMA domain-containing protein n=1 Tax=Candidatus Woesebacteria bacterium GW2011_GWB1_33_22 TaxID=1618566 RepID=A0A0G0C1S1_9BACT|nr:MAG: hypothetical protein UR29_C0005G0023 [Candidatus Woesebacteria bacterium GW2011_GWC2_33_12]KKP42329.1 MAG: hypothetical protein UR33_C0003G0022 [Candidatus Woesebacteria bacterium GW2011_GWA2_33_20]KKP45080.1 MAG: hypothetical protein UR35_C0003G0022 [Candidatus Woesebacteria bacterium GW2011_GWB1_33_22]KKP46956.1 MAG: hypothetical protein UR37_C0003G0022 [Microgenomates group bacterium GW2011_GWC1_33_28]KKP50782.1 MAG: hypothetical protein UR41_C0003G0022 [Candidatus Woesebacteria bact
MNTQIIYITGTHCPACKKLIERKISGINNVISVSVDFETGETIIESKRPIEKAEINLSLEGMPYEQKD